MTYATTYHIGYDTHTQRAKAKTVAPPVERIYQLDESPKGRRRNTKGQTAVCTDNHVANGFLRTSFLPKLNETETVQACRKSAKTERDFYKSLSRLAGHYCIEPMPTQSYGYPYNIALALWDTQEQLSKKVRDWEEIKLLQDSRKTYLTSEERYNTGSTLFYIPVVPLYRMLRDPKRKHTAQLLLSVCTYLYHVVDIPYYRQENSFLYWQYEMLKEWVVSDEYTDEMSSYLSELEQAEWIGDRMEQKIFHRANLTFFKERLTRFKSTDALDLDCLTLAQEAFELYQQYPNENVFRNARPNGEAEEDDMEYVVTMDKYVSFCADGKGWLNENLEQCVNTDLQEYGQMEEPVILKCFDGSDITGNNLDFENRLFTLMEELAYLLSNI
ncbi:MAG: hypothetical protein J0G98_14580 [Terrimonas ferruginea]|mgnify:CR=1 FL=1|jgi:hypothetical protein|uniref:hypothetical protein n=1 Tax=Terrimonas ferruginea TaxID=249 RepID=UPI000929CE2D|nr:hypothetical protein [Terrimonas ferruginea]MBX3242245.1 hypothetical protein [Chitinophagaceae bacterium]OJW45727.1 MAG: hypothetical protein BGO56_00695 [Sphingobacteriales bacterium 48-107]ULT39669.1 hypothetical protein KRR40_32830 [Niabella sp. I65]MBN8784282.1 hypothetical protein [Terrimonas ferruginea]MCW5928173.1 hypothetical protein [Chitinophagaceae bacterium]